MSPHRLRHIEFKKKHKPKAVVRLRDFCTTFGLSASELARVLGRDPKAVGHWFEEHDQSMPDWADLIMLREYAAKKGRPYDFFRMVDETTETALRLAVQDRPGLILDLTATIYQYHGSVRKLEASAESGAIDLRVTHPHPNEVLVAAIQQIRGVDRVEVSREEPRQ